MSEHDRPAPAVPPIRREPPQFRRARVASTSQRGPALVRVTLVGPELVGIELGDPAASVRLLLPGADRSLELPTWNGNEFLAADGSRPTIRTLTPIDVRDRGTGEAELDVEVVLHGSAPLSAWATHADEGDEVAVSGTGSGYKVDPGARRVVLLGDESAIPAISTLVERLPSELDVQAIIEVRDPDFVVELPTRPGPARALADAVA